MKPLTVFTFAVAVAACAPKPAALSSLTRVSAVTAGAKCSSGGVDISVGPDLNGNGVLDDVEVASTQVLCNGAAGAAGAMGQPGATGPAGRDGTDGRDGTNGRDGADGPSGAGAPTPLTATATLPVGDPRCPTGGARVDFGVDVGGGDGGIARDGVLQPSEVQSSQVVCNGALPYYERSVTAPSGPPGAFRIVTAGAKGVSAATAGGDITIGLVNGTFGGNVKVFRTGVVDAGFTVPKVAFDAGEAPVVVDHDLTFTQYSDLDAGLAAHDWFFGTQGGDTWVVRDGGAVLATSVVVTANHTVRCETCWFRVKNDVRLEGSLVAKAGVVVIAGQYVSTPGSVVSVAGLSSAVASGANGGSLSLFADVAVNAGLIDLTGGNGTEGGGMGGTAWLVAPTIVNAGVIRARGGDGSTGRGGSGGAVVFQGDEVSNRATLDVSGGNGIVTGGGDSSVGIILVGRVIRNSGSLVARGGACTGASCLAGRGASVTLSARGHLFNSGDLDSSGGAGPAGRGGDANKVTVASTEDTASASSQFATGDLHLSGNITAQGGEGATAGGSGSVLIQLTSNHPRGQEIELLGYTELDASGGRSASGNGGTGGHITLSTAPTTYGAFTMGDTGAVVNQATLNATGGDGLVAGAGGTVKVASTQTFASGNPHEFILNAGAIVASGGDGSASPGGGGSVTIGGANTENRAAIWAQGGTSSSAMSPGGRGGTVAFAASLASLNSGDIHVDGHNGPVEGGRGGTISIRATNETNTALLSATGGNGQQTGGPGGTIDLRTWWGARPSNTGPMRVNGGSGVRPGAPGAVYERMYGL